MYCSACGIELADNFLYCPQCGTATSKNSFTSTTGTPRRLLSRPREDRKLAGVCSGIARYLGIDVTLVRVIMCVLALWPPCIGLVLYIICWIIMPADPLLLAPPREATPTQNVATT
jgi:phage shock protein C